MAKASNYHIEVVDDPARISGDEWNALLALQAAPTPFMRHEFIAALHDSGCAAGGSGWAARLVTLRRDGRLDGAVAAWEKTHSWGEYVFDQAWAQAYAQHGLAYYPKWVAAVPFTPVPGSRLLVRQYGDRAPLLQALATLARESAASSVHLLFGDAADLAAAERAGWLLRRGVQFHWRNRPEAPWADFDDFLASLQRDKRKKIQQERRRVREASVRFEASEGAAITEAQWDFFHHCYTQTYLAHGHLPYLNREAFARLARDLPEHWLLFTALRGDAPLACSLLAIDRATGTAWGRYWGAVEHVPCLHFDACYYQPLAWCIAQGFQRFEGGAQGEHKMARGLLPVETGSAHWLEPPAFHEAVARFLAREGRAVEAYVDELNERTPFRANPPPVP